MDSDILRLGELVCARVCHDLGGLAGTLAGALDLAQEDGGGEAVAVAREAAEALSCRLRLLRTALGPVSEPLGAGAVTGLASGLGERLQVDATGLGPAPLPGAHARLALAMLLLGAEALPRGGVLHLSVDASGGLQVVGHGSSQGWPPGVAQSLTGALPEEARNMMAPFCGLIARAAGMELAIGNAPPTLRAAPRSPSRA